MSPRTAQEIATDALSAKHCGGRATEQCRAMLRSCGCEVNAAYVVDALRANPVAVLELLGAERVTWAAARNQSIWAFPAITEEPTP